MSVTMTVTMSADAWNAPEQKCNNRAFVTPIVTPIVTTQLFYIQEIRGRCNNVTIFSRKKSCGAFRMYTHTHEGLSAYSRDYIGIHCYIVTTPKTTF